MSVANLEPATGRNVVDDRPLRVLVVDDSVIYRKAVSEALADCKAIEVVGTAANGVIALSKISQLKPDLLTLDLEMPELDGHGVLEQINQRKLDVGVVIVSSISKKGAQATTRALEAGAFDFITKPAGVDAAKNKEQLAKELLAKIRAFQFKTASDRDTRRPAANALPGSICRSNLVPRSRRFEMIAIGVSTGGPAALAKLIPKLPKDCPVPIVIVQHMPPVFTASLAEELDRDSALTVQEGQDGMVLTPGMVVIAPGGKQMKVDKAGGSPPRIVITDDPAERSCRPSVDYLFRSLANHYSDNCLAIIMTGMGDDGLQGCQLLKQQGATILAQDKESSVVYGMPRQIVEHELADAVCSLADLPAEIRCLVNQRIR